MKIQRTKISHFFHFNLKSALLSLMIITKNPCKITSFPIFSTLTLGRFYLFPVLPIFINEDTKNKNFPFFPLMLSLPIFIDEKTSLASFPYFFNFNLKWALPIFIDENTKHFLHLIGRNIASYLFSLYLGTNLLHFPFFHFNLGSALPLFIDENTKNTHEIPSFPVFLSYWA